MHLKTDKSCQFSTLGLANGRHDGPACAYLKNRMMSELLPAVSPVRIQMFPMASGRPNRTFEPIRQPEPSLSFATWNESILKTA